MVFSGASREERWHPGKNTANSLGFGFYRKMFSYNNYLSLGLMGGVYRMFCSQVMDLRSADSRLKDSL